MQCGCQVVDVGIASIHTHSSRVKKRPFAVCRRNDLKRQRTGAMMSAFKTKICKIIMEIKIGLWLKLRRRFAILPFVLMTMSLSIQYTSSILYQLKWVLIYFIDLFHFPLIYNGRKWNDNIRRQIWIRSTGIGIEKSNLSVHYCESPWVMRASSFL